LIISDRAIAMGMAAHAPSPPPQSRDSLKNGAIIGAVIGGVAMGAAGTWVCSMLREPGDPPCWKSVLPVAAIFAGIGAAAGAGIDALANVGASRRAQLHGSLIPTERPPQFLRRKDRCHDRDGAKCKVGPDPEEHAACAYTLRADESASDHMDVGHAGATDRPEQDDDEPDARVAERENGVEKYGDDHNADVVLSSTRLESADHIVCEMK
jgi:hypothetical protein